MDEQDSAQDAQEVYRKVLSALENCEILGVELSSSTPQRMLEEIEASGVLMSLRWNKNSFEFLHPCCSGTHPMKVVLDTNEVYMGGLRIDELDDWEATAGYFSAMLFDPRWLVKWLRDITVSELSDGLLLLRGNIYPIQCGLFGKVILRDLEKKNKEQMINEFKQFYREMNGIGMAPIPDSAIPLTLEGEAKMDEFLRPLNNYTVEELRENFKRANNFPLQFELRIDADTFLPLVVKITNKLLLDVFKYPPYGIWFIYAQEK